MIVVPRQEFERAGRANGDLSKRGGGWPCRLFFFCAVVLSAPVSAEEVPSVVPGPKLGDCVLFREGGVGFIFKTPTYWLKGKVAEISQEHRLAGRCPKIGKSETAYNRDDWARIAAATPCVESDAEVREVPVLRIHVAVEEWETPWSIQHGTVGWLFRGQFLNTPLRRGELIDMDATWLERCEPST